MINNKSLLEKLKFYAQKNKNVLLTGLHGVGKTSIVESVFKSMGWNYLILNGSTMDPYLHLIGIATTVKIEIDGETVDVLKQVLPEVLAQDNIDALFIDEINRGSKEILNGLLDLIQFKSINSKKLHRLKVVWAAQNPYFDDLDEDEQIYDVKPLDPALKDRFHLFLDVPYKLDKEYLKNKYSHADPFIKWWDDLPEKMQLKISPRRLDYAMNIFNEDGDLYDVIDNNLPISKLISNIDEFITNNKNKLLLKEITSSKNINEITNLINIENIESFIQFIKNNKLKSLYLKYINQDIIDVYVSSHKNDKKLLEILNTLHKEGEIELTKNVMDIISNDFFESKKLLKELDRINNFTFNKENLDNINLIILDTIYKYHKSKKQLLTIDEIYNNIADMDFFTEFTKEVNNWNMQLLRDIKQKNEVSVIKFTNNDIISSLVIGKLYKKAISIDLLSKYNIEKINDGLRELFNRSEVRTKYKYNHFISPFILPEESLNELVLKVDNSIKKILNENIKNMAEFKSKISDNNNNLLKSYTLI